MMLKHIQPLAVCLCFHVCVCVRAGMQAMSQVEVPGAAHLLDHLNRPQLIGTVVATCAAWRHRAKPGTHRPGTLCSRSLREMVLFFRTGWKV